jgi:uncharacterized protein (DUF1501 family)
VALARAEHQEADMSEKKPILTRRSMLAAVTGAGLAGMQALGGAKEQASGSALAAAGPRDAPKGDIAAKNHTLVCIYLLGGSDGNSLIAPLDPPQYAAWEKARGELALRADGLLPIRTRSAKTEYGLHPALVELQTYFNEGAGAVVANVGPASRPNPVSPNSRYDSLSFLKDGYSTLDWAAKKAGARLDNDIAFTFGNGVSMMPIGDTRFEGDRRKNPALMDKIAAASFKTSFPDSVIGRQMKNVAGLLKGGNETGASGQVVFCPLGGFGTSVAQMKMKSPLYGQLSAAMGALYRATIEMGISGQVTIFTESEFGRTLRPNASHGADPGWGNNHFVLGGAVRGGEVYGKFPDMLAGPFDSDSALIPTTSTAQYQATLAAWLGISAGELPSLLPELDGSPRLAFLRA